MTAGRPVNCQRLGGTRLTWITDDLAVCQCHPNNVWRWRRRGSRMELAGEWNKTAVELAHLLAGRRRPRRPARATS